MNERRAFPLTVYRPADGAMRHVPSSTHDRILAVEGSVRPEDGAAGLPIFTVSRKSLVTLARGEGAIQTGELLYLVPLVDDRTAWFAFGGNFAWSTDSRVRQAWGDRPLPIHDHHEGP